MSLQQLLQPLNVVQLRTLAANLGMHDPPYEQAALVSFVDMVLVMRGGATGLGRITAEHLIAQYATPVYTMANGVTLDTATNTITLPPGLFGSDSSSASTDTSDSDSE